MHVLTNALEQKRLKSENAYLHKQLDERFGLGSMVGKSAAMRALFQLIETVAPTAATILISGETGTGKEMVARAIHQTSPRHRERFVAINVSAIPETLLDAELFGHVRGAFTGAVAMRQGRLEQADKGTLFLDEVGTMPMALQMKMLRVLQEREFERVGDTKTIRVDVRIIAATNKDLEREVREGRFREDLYFRLNVIDLHMPSLRDRAEDIPELAEGLLQRSFVAAKRPPRPLSHEARRAIETYPWPGNIRELKNALERAAILCSTDQVTLDDLPDRVAANSLQPSLHSQLSGAEGTTATLPPAMGAMPAAELSAAEVSLEELERRHIEAVLGSAATLEEAATVLGINLSTLWRKRRRYGLD